MTWHLDPLPVPRGAAELVTEARVRLHGAMDRRTPHDLDAAFELYAESLRAAGLPEPPPLADWPATHPQTSGHQGRPNPRKGTP